MPDSFQTPHTKLPKVGTTIFTVMSQLAAEHGAVLVEKFLPGDDYRLLVVGDRLVAAARREPPLVIGDGLQTVRELVDAVNMDPRRGDGPLAADAAERTWSEPVCRLYSGVPATPPCALRRRRAQPRSDRQPAPAGPPNRPPSSRLGGRRRGRGAHKETPQGWCDVQDFWSNRRRPDPPERAPDAV